MHSSTVENYAKNIFLVSKDTGQATVSMGSIADALEVVPGTATSMAKALAKAGLAEYEPRAGVRLTEEGVALALRVLRRHRLVEYFLVETLKMDWSEIHDEAEALEHSISDRLLDRLDKFLGEPRFDPHGDPIPTASGEMIERNLSHLGQCQEGDSVIIRRISDQDVSFLNYAQENGLMPGTPLILSKRNEIAECIEVKLEIGGVVTFGFQAAGKIWVEHAQR